LPLLSFRSGDAGSNIFVGGLLFEYLVVRKLSCEALTGSVQANADGVERAAKHFSDLGVGEILPGYEAENFGIDGSKSLKSVPYYIGLVRHVAW